MAMFFILLLFTACAPKLQIYSPPLPPAIVSTSEKELNGLLKKMDAASVLRTAELHPNFLSPRVRILLLESLVELGSYSNALALGEELLKIPAQPEKTQPAVLKSKQQKFRTRQSAEPSAKKTQKKRTRKLRASKTKPEYLSSSQRNKVYFYLALSCQALNMREKASFYFEKTRERPNYFYLYRYAQAEKQEGNFTKSLMLLEESYERSLGSFTYINDAYAFALTEEAFRVHKRKPQEAKAKLSLVLGDKNLFKSPAAARAEILWSQWF